MSKLKSNRGVKKQEAIAPQHRRSPENSSGADVQLLALQQTIGNQGVNQLLQFSSSTPSGLKLSSPADTHEQEADRVAQKITQPAGETDSDQSLKQLGRAAVSSGNSLGPGKPLPTALRSELEPRLGYDLSSVRIHENEPAAESARSINASAYTVGTNVIFGHNQFAPQTSAGKQLLAHELTHVVQQTQTPASGPISHVSQSPGLVQRKEDWDFTRKDYQILLKKKGALKISSDSSWFPNTFQENLLNTLNFLFDPKAKTPGTEGVNIKDLYHGHVGLDKKIHKSGHPQNLSEKRTKFEEKQAELHKKALGGDASNPVTKANVQEFKKAEEASLPLAGDMLTDAAKEKGVVVVYHTFEFSKPSDLKGGSLKPGDPRRNYMTPLDTNTPASFSPPDPENASSWSDNYWELFQFSFLVDEKGEVHVRSGSTKELSSVTGTPLS